MHSKLQTLVHAGSRPFVATAGRTWLLRQRRLERLFCERIDKLQRHRQVALEGVAARGEVERQRIALCDLVVAERKGLARRCPIDRRRGAVASSRRYRSRVVPSTGPAESDPKPRSPFRLSVPNRPSWGRQSSRMEGSEPGRGGRRRGRAGSRYTGRAIRERGWPDRAGTTR